MKINNLPIANDQRLTVFGGVNVIESDDLLFRVAEEFKSIAEKYKFSYVFKASFDKANRSSADSFRGPGLEEGLESLRKVKEKFDVPLITDIHESDQAEAVAEVCDVIQIPAFLCRQTDLIIAAAKTKKIINIKKPQFSSAKEMFHAVSKCEKAGNSDVILCERGNIFGYNNLVVDTLNFQILKDSGKPSNIIEKISLGKLQKFKQENSLMSQIWVMDTKKKVSDIISELNFPALKVKDFFRLKIGD